MLNPQSRALEYRFADDMKRIIYAHTTQIATVRTGTRDEDFGGVDLVLPQRTFGTRVRNAYALGYRDVTFRCRTRHNVRTEWHRLIDGDHPDGFVYAIADAAGLSLARWHILNLHVLHDHINDVRATTQSNHDGTAFYAVPIDDLEAIGAVVAASEPAQMTLL